MAKEPEDKRKIKRIPSLKNYGGVRTIQKTLERSATLEANREAVSYALLTMANTNLTDIMSWDEDGNIKVKASFLNTHYKRLRALSQPLGMTKKVILQRH